MRIIAFVTILGVFSVLIWPVSFIIALIYKLTKVKKMSREMFPEIYNGYTQPEPDTYDEIEECQVQDDIEDNDYDELPFCQLFTIGTEMCLLIDHIEMCPDETAFIRVVDDEGYTPLYKRKVRRDKGGNRYIVFNSINHYLDNKKTQPVITKK